MNGKRRIQELLGALGALLAALGAILERHAKIIKKSMPKMLDFGSEKGAQREPKSNPKPIKIEDKNRCEKRTEIRPSWARLGAILGHFWSPLGVIFVDFPLVFKGFSPARPGQATKFLAPEIAGH